MEKREEANSVDGVTGAIAYIFASI